ncbi:putative transcriptional regulator [Paenibacillus phyllosphaerae]|uniref:Putative transcriptional regulator n=1 Tax=Paenibacillus phyllosphaerae TaxID=274593 RepID=A0A7W5FP39_9BACL|nr:helix-turn-helix domain-containing protein [Paenibacillus phyllosphaerae]MBB3111659.1 putative transcriptional regulator [Paenibacillus phyllosphaerae]
MLSLSTDEQSLLVYEALASKPRLAILQMVAEQPLSVKEIADRLSFSSATVTVHIRKLEEAGLLLCRAAPGKHGQQKICSLTHTQFEGRFDKQRDADHSFTCSIRVGHYTDYMVKPTCGLAESSGFIGQIDDPRYFSDPLHFNADVIWFGEGYVEYRIPNYLLKNQQLERLEISLELCSEAPGANENWPSDIFFELNRRQVGTWTCPGDFGDKRGALNPDWWPRINKTQYGLLKIITINEEGSFIDGLPLSGVTIRDLDLTYGADIPLRIGVASDARHVGGVTLFGQQFGNYNQNIEVEFRCKPSGARRK